MSRQRLACTNCGTHRHVLGAATCPSCGSTSTTAVRPTPGDRAAVEADLIAAAEAVDRELLQTGVVHRSHDLARQLAAACQELALVRAGVCTR